MSIKKYNFDIVTIDKKSASEFLKKYHYLSSEGESKGFRSGYNFALTMTINEHSELVGICIFHSLSSQHTTKGLFGIKDTKGEGGLELGRFCLSPTLQKETEKNISSWFLAKCIKRVRQLTEVRFILTYADTRFHVGTIYQATNFLYIGPTKVRIDPIVNGHRVSRGKTKHLNVERRRRPIKYRYILIFDKYYKKLLKPSILPYPKRRLI